MYMDKYVYVLDVSGDVWIYEYVSMLCNN